jgi:hypothetical protein
MEHYSALKRKEILPHATTGASVEGTTLSDTSLSLQDSTSLRDEESSDSQRQEAELWVPGGHGEPVQMGTEFPLGKVKKL